MLHKVTSALLMVVLLTAGIAKFATGRFADAMLSGYWSWLAASGELVLAAMVLKGGRGRRIAAISSQWIALGGLAASYLGGRPCGCLGSWVLLGPRDHVVIAAGTGLLASIVLATTRRVRLVPVDEAAAR